MDEDNVEVFCFSIPEKIDVNDSSSSSDDSDIEVTSTIDEEENELIQISNNLSINSDDSADDNVNSQDNSTIQSHPEVRTSQGDENSGDNLQTEASATPSQKRKRCAWSVKEKLEAIENYEASKSKHSTAKHIGCTRFQLTKWLNTKEELKNLQSLNKGKPLNHDQFHILCFSFRWTTKTS